MFFRKNIIKTLTLFPTRVRAAFGGPYTRQINARLRNAFKYFIFQSQKIQWESLTVQLCFTTLLFYLRQFQSIQDHSNLFRTALCYPRLIETIPDCSSLIQTDCTIMIKTILCFSRPLYSIQNYSVLFQSIYPSLFKTVSVY